MDLKTQFLEKLDEARDNFQFPYWECGEENAYVGKMRVSGFKNNRTIALAFELFEFSIKENLIQSIIYFLTPEESDDWLQPGNSLSIQVNNNEDDEFPIEFGFLNVNVKGENYSVNLDKNHLLSKGYIEDDATSLNPAAIVLEIKDTLPNDSLFSDPGFIIESFELDSDTERIFCIEDWQHPTFEELYDEEKLPSKYPDIIALVTNLIDTSQQFTPIQETNTSWEKQCRES